MVRLFVYMLVGASLLATVPHYLMRYQDQDVAGHHIVADGTRSGALQADGWAGGGDARNLAAYASGRSVRLDADPRGHFIGEFRVNGRPVEGLVDTGATLMAINVSTARRLGVSPPASDFVHVIGTANGRTDAARVLLDTVEIGPIRLRAVEAYVLEDESLSTMLVGMSFMNRLGSFGVENGRLLLVD